MFSEFAWIILLTLLPTLELRASIPYGVLSTNLHWSVVFLVAVITNMILGAVVFTIIDKTLHMFIKYPWFKKPYEWYHKRVQKKIEKKVEKYGELGVALFIGVPLPGSGSYSGALASHLLGLNFRQFFIANMIGVLIAGVIVLVVSLTGGEAWSMFIKV